MVGTDAPVAHAGGVMTLLGDGSVHFTADDIDASLFQALGTIAGGETIGAF